MSYGFSEEFSTRVKHNFKQYVLLTSRNIHWREEYILETIFGLNGYKCHKTVKYEDNSSHIHVKFEEEYMAKEAVDFLINLSSDLTVVLVDDMLRDWYSFEKNWASVTPWSIAVVDVIGNPPFGLNFLTERILQSVFRDFFKPYFLPYTAALNEPHVQVVFGSMTEALAACVVFGEWWVKDQKMDSFCFRVRINPSQNEAMLIGFSGGTPQEAFKLDYFVNLRNESAQTTYQTKHFEGTIQSYSYLRNKESKKIQKSNFETGNIDQSQNGIPAPVNNGNLICVPIIAPFNCYAQALMASNKQMKAGSTNVHPDFKRSQNIQGSEDEMGYLSSSQSRNVVDCQLSVQRINTDTSNKIGVSPEVICSDLILDTVKNKQEKPDLIPHVVPMKPKRNCKKAHLKNHGRK